MSESIEMKSREPFFDGHACLTGDCLHTTQKECLEAAYNQCGKDMREKVGEGFDEWMKNNEPPYLDQLWMDATLSADKRHAEEIRVRDERIETLETSLFNCIEFLEIVRRGQASLNRMSVLKGFFAGELKTLDEFICITKKQLSSKEGES